MNKFSDYVTSSAFNLSLSKPMIECISQLHGRGSSWANMSTANALENRGLVTREEFRGAGEFVSCRLVLTEAGKAVVPLLELAGLLTKWEPLVPAVELPKVSVTLKKEMQP